MTTRKHVFYGILALVSLLGLGITQSARANFMATIDQVGTNVVANGSGAINLTGLSFLAWHPGGSETEPPIGVIVTGTTDSANVTFFSGLVDRPVSEAGMAILPAVAAETVSALWAFSGSFRCQMAMCLVLLY